MQYTLAIMLLQSLVLGIDNDPPSDYCTSRVEIEQ